MKVSAAEMAELEKKFGPGLGVKMPPVKAYNECSPASVVTAMPGHFTTPDEGVMQTDSTRTIVYLNEIPADRIVARCVHEGNPLGKQRPRFNQKTGRVYTPGATKRHEQELAMLASFQIPPSQREEKDWAYGIRAIFYVQTHQRKDVDNMLKAVLDGVNHMAFADDSQVHELMGWKLMDCIRPRTEFIVYRLYKIDRDTGQCIRCGKTFRRYKSWKARLYCSRECNAISSENKLPCDCAHCGKTFHRTPSEIEAVKGGKMYCTSFCRGKARRREVACSACGAAISRPNAWTKPGQENYYCTRGCYDKGKTGKKLKITAESLAERSKKAWITRKLTTGMSG